MAISSDGYPMKPSFAHCRRPWRTRIPIQIGKSALLIIGVLLLGQAHAEKADREKPLQIEADRLDYDEANRVNVFNGRVTMTKGTLLIRADRVVLKEEADGSQNAVATGKPASLRQRRDGAPDSWVEGQGERIEWDGRAEIARFIQKAQLRKLEAGRVIDDVQGGRIRYDSRAETYDVEGGAAAATPDNPGGRVRVIIAPRTPK